MRGLLSSRTLLPLAAATCLAAGPALATLLTGPFAGGQSWGGGVATDGTTFFIDNDGDGTPENYPVPAALKPTVPFTFFLSALPSPRFLYAIAGDPTCGGAGSARVFYYDVVQDSPTAGHLTAITNRCIPNGIAFDGYALGQQPIAFVAGTSLPADTTQTMFWINLGTGGTGSSALTRDLDHVGFPQFPPSVTVAFTRELPAMPTTATYHLVDLCPATLGSLLNPGGGMLANLPAPEPTAAVLDTGGGHFVARVSHPSLPGGSIDLALSDCVAMATTTTTTTPTSSTIASTTITTSTTTTTLPPTVTTTDAFAPGGLLDVVDRVNAGQPGPITFAIPGPGPYVIDVSTVVLALTRSVTIDGTSQQSPHGTPLVQIHGQLEVEAPGCIVKGLAIDGGIFVMPPADGTLIQDNYLGIAPDGVTRNSTGAGINIGTSNNTIQSNLIAGLILIGETAGDPPATHNLVRDNRIGTNAAGTAFAGGGLVEVRSANNVIGGTAPGDGNVIAGSVEIGSLSLPPPPSSAAGVLVAGNFIGTDVTGMVVLGRGGVHILGRSGNASGNTVGPGNVITEGIFIQGGNGNAIKGNLIGTDVTGGKVLVSLVGGEPAPGIEVLDSSDNTIGGTAAADRNVVAGHASAIKGQGVVDGILIDGIPPAEARGNRVLGNFVGTDITGTLPLPNDIGVNLANAQDTVIGGADPGAGNTIAFNRGDGVYVAAGDGNTVQGNSIDQNGGAGIHLLSGANGGIAPPVLTSYAPSATTSTFVGHAAGPANGLLTVEFFANPAGDDQGRTFCGRKTYMADAGGKITFRETFACPVTDPREAAIGTATVTDAAGNTSEFSLVGGMPTVSTTTTTRPSPTSTIPTTTTSTTLPLDSLAGVLSAVTTIQDMLDAPPQPECTARCRCSTLAAPLDRVAKLVAEAREAATPKKCKRKLESARRRATMFKMRVKSLVRRKCLAPLDRGTTLEQEAGELATRTRALFTSRYCAGT